MAKGRECQAPDTNRKDKGAITVGDKSCRNSENTDSSPRVSSTIPTARASRRIVQPAIPYATTRTRKRIRTTLHGQQEQHAGKDQHS